MFEQKRFLMIPGPTPVPESALLEMARHPLPHRSPEFSAIFDQCNEGLKYIAQTKQAMPVIYAASGTGGMESILANLMNPGDRILSIVNGVFGARWADMAEGFGGQVERITLEPGKAVSVDQVADTLKKDYDRKIKLVLLTFSETSTGVVNPVQEIAKLVKDHGALLAVDAITGLGAMPLKMDDWGIDVLVSGSQKGFMIPPGLAFVWVSERAMEVHKASKFPRFYWDWSKVKKALDDHTTPFTPNVTLICALRETLRLMKEEGVDKTWLRHARLRNCVRKSVMAMGLKLLTEDYCGSAAITSILPPEGISVKDIRAGLKKDWQIVVADGQASLQGKIFRIGHLGYVNDRDALTALSTLAEVLKGLGFAVDLHWLEVYSQELQKAITLESLNYGIPNPELISAGS
ncbi:MAG: alanine--glyoxylate aminotransferase family protein [Candidatus Caenarcaniphilales bacterium]|nr:alanine--glyoxylate aminotransferase family protein [Candidatus Caenarcaniphilales bacterium]